jgi:beta-glucanase (GH16 family)
LEGNDFILIMHRSRIAVLVGSLLIVALALSGESSARPGWKLAWSDEFNGAEGASPDPAKWTFELGGAGWGNDELETYTARPANARLHHGKLVITARREPFTGSDGIARAYTSARLKSEGKFEQRYGRFEARLKLPAGRGLWPAFWLLGAKCDKVGWPQCGEIDIMENVGSEPSVVLGSLHGPGYSGADSITARYTLPGGKRFSDGYHLFAVEWEPGVVRFYVDHDLYATRTPADLPPGATWVFDHPFFIILNVAVGGGLPGSPDAATVFPQEMSVDYVRVYERKP